MYQAWPWGAPATASPTSGYVQPTASTQVATTQWPAGYSQYAVSPEIQQQWAAAWASQAQYAYSTNVPVGEAQTTAYTGAYPDYQTAASTVATTSETKKSDDGNQTSDKPKTSAEQPISKDLAESERIKLLEEQAEKWKSLQQPAASWSSNVTISNTTTVTAPNDASKSLTSTNVTQSGLTQSQMSKEEEEFERQFKDWEKQFENWKQQNQNHPDKEAFSQYEKQWQEWRVQLLQKKEQMQKAKAEQSGASQQLAGSGSVAGVGNTQTTSADTTAAAAAASTPGMYYQPQYMYMQPYMYPGATSVASVAVPPAVVQPAVMPPGMVPPAGVPPVAMQPGAIPPQQMAYGPPGLPNSYGNQSHLGMVPHNENMNYRDYENEGGMYSYGPMHGNGPRDDGMGPVGYEGYEDPNMLEGDYGRDGWKFARARGRAVRGRARGRGSRWSEPTEMDMAGGVKPQRKTLLPGGPASLGTFPEEDDPPPFEYPTEDCRDQFKQDAFPVDRHGNHPLDAFEFHDGPYPSDDAFAPPPFDDRYPPDQYPPEEEFPEMFPPDQRFPDRKRFPSDQDCFPRERFPPDHDRFPHDDRFPPDQGCFPPDLERFPPEDDRYPPGHERFPSRRHMMDDGGFGEFHRYPPEDEMYGPFRDDFPPFDDRNARGRSRYNGRGRRYGDFDRFGAYPPRMRNESFGPQDDFPLDDGFGFPNDGLSRGMRSQFGPEGRFPDDADYYGDRFKSIDYTHRPAADVMGDEYNPHYDFEDDFQDDVNAYRDNFSSGVNVAPIEPIIFSQVNVESFDYGHGMKPMTSTTIEGKENFKDSESTSSAKGFEFPYHRDRSSPLLERNFKQERNADDSNDRDSVRDRESYRIRDKDRCRDRSKESDRDSEKDRDRDKDRKENRDSRDRDNRDRDSRNRDNRDRDNRDRDSRDRDNHDRSRGKDRDSKRDRDWDSDTKRDEDKRFKWDKNHDSDRDFSKDKNRNTSSSKNEIDTKTVEVPCQYKPQPDIFKNDSCSETVLIEDILVEPKRSSRPKQLVIILRGLPGSGKTYFAKLIKDKEIENGGSAPRILSLDDYFMVETEVTETDPDTGKRVKRKEFKFEHEYEMEETYRSSLFKSFKKTIDDRFFPFIIVDAVHEKSKQYEDYWSYAKQKGFQVYIAEMDCKDPVMCHKRNIHKRTLEDINKILQQWEPKPRHFIGMDVRSLLQDVSITEVEMEVESSFDKPLEKDEELFPDEDSEESNLFPGHEPSRWEKLEATEEKLDQLDGLRVNKKKHSSMEDYLQLPDDYDERKCEPGKKRVRWADLEQRKEQDRLRAIGFVVGQTDWTKLTDPTQADKALTKTKYF